ncbi:MAG: 50S ribosomal protein L22 [Anaerolineales bacterium]|nr:50S ribosomal protein L22 [Anaerolineales bacterium]
MTDETNIRASVRFVPMSPQKVRLVIDLIRGMDTNAALDVLQFTPNAAAHPVKKLIRSAVANAEENYGVSRDDLYIHEIKADKGPTRRWRRFGARGRFKPIKRRYSHISVILREFELDED